MKQEIRICTDQMGRELKYLYPPKRIISLVPSQTELLHDLGLDEEVVGITKFCVHPEEWFRSKTRVGGTKAVNFEKIKELQPDLIIANKEENLQSEIELLSKDFPVWLSDMKTLSGALDMIHGIGQLVNRVEEAKQISAEISKAFTSLSEENKILRSCAYFIWWNPIMTVGSDTFIHEMLERCGWKNVFADGEDKRYPMITDEQLKAAQPELILLSSEPFPFTEKYKSHFQELLPNSKILLVDGEMFSWYGSRLIHSAAYFHSLLSELKS